MESSIGIIVFLGLIIPQQTLAANLDGVFAAPGADSAAAATPGVAAAAAGGVAPSPAVAAAAAAAAAAPGAASTGTGVPNPNNSNPKCNFGDVGCYLTNGLIGLLAQIAYWMLTVVGWLLGLVGMIFNWTVVITVFQYGAYFANSQGMLVAWGILRDIGNIIILFGFLFIGIMMILDLHSFDARHSLPRLIIFAVLLNFSLFAGEAIVDIANVLSSQIYIQAGQSTLGSVSTSGSSSNLSGSSNGLNVRIAGAILRTLAFLELFRRTLHSRFKSKYDTAPCVHSSYDIYGGSNDGSYRGSHYAFHSCSHAYSASCNFTSRVRWYGSSPT